MIGRYQTARAFRAAVDERLKQTARATGTDLMRLRRQVAFDRFLARLFTEETSEPPWLLKGGYALEIRLGGRARATKDIDLSLVAPSRLDANAGASRASVSMALRETLQEAAARDLRDAFVFRVGAPMADLDAAPYGGARFPIEARLDARVFATFHLDVGIGDAVVSPPEWLACQDLLVFAGIQPALVAAIAREQQFAEKIHAYTLPRSERVNTRVKDLADLVLLLEFGLAGAEHVRGAVRATFARRGTHPIPLVLDPPPADWAAPYLALAVECGLGVATLADAFATLVAYWETLWEGIAP